MNSLLRRVNKILEEAGGKEPPIVRYLDRDGQEKTALLTTWASSGIGFDSFLGIDKGILTDDDRRFVALVEAYCAVD